MELALFLVINIDHKVKGKSTIEDFSHSFPWVYDLVVGRWNGGLLWALSPLPCHPLIYMIHINMHSLYQCHLSNAHPWSWLPRRQFFETKLYLGAEVPYTFHVLPTPLSFFLFLFLVYGYGPTWIWSEKKKNQICSHLRIGLASIAG